MPKPVLSLPTVPWTSSRTAASPLSSIPRRVSATKYFDRSLRVRLSFTEAALTLLTSARTTEPTLNMTFAEYWLRRVLEAIFQDRAKALLYVAISYVINGIIDLAQQKWYEGPAKKVEKVSCRVLHRHVTPL